VVAHDAKEVCEIFDAVGVGSIMHAVERREFRTALLGELREMFRYGFVAVFGLVVDFATVIFTKQVLGFLLSDRRLLWLFARADLHLHSE